MATTKKAVAPTVGALCDKHWDLREAKRKLEAQVKTLTEQMTENEEAIVLALEAQGLDAGKGKKGSVSLGAPSVHFSFDDEHNGFEEFAKFVKKTGFFHLFQRRVSEVAVREIFEKKGVVPGLKHFTKRKLNLTTVTQ